MIELAASARGAAAGVKQRRVNLLLGEDTPWLAAMAAMTSLELVWWAICFSKGIAPSPYFPTYLALAFGGLAPALAIRWMLWNLLPRAAWPALLCGTMLLAVGASLFLPLKFAIPREIPFWLDQPLASGEWALFGTDPWLLFDRVLGWAIVPVDRIYGLWLPVQSAVFYAVLVAPPSPAKSRALVAYSLAWFVLGVAAATLFSSAGPIFYDRLFGGDRFATLNHMLHVRGATLALAESDAMWVTHVSGRSSLVAGMSAVPSLHVAISLWIYLTARTMAPRVAPLALVYTIFIWAASVQLGWHYASDGLIGALGMLAIWSAAGLGFPYGRVSKTHV